MLREAEEAIANQLEPLKEIARLNVSPVLQGPQSKAEVQVFYAESKFAPSPATFNSVGNQLRTLTFRVNIELKDLRDHRNAYPLIEQVQNLLAGFQPLGPQEVPRDGEIYILSDRLAPVDQEASFWVYTVLVAFETLFRPF